MLLCNHLLQMEISLIIGYHLFIIIRYHFIFILFTKIKTKFTDVFTNKNKWIIIINDAIYKNYILEKHKSTVDLNNIYFIIQNKRLIIIITSLRTRFT